MYVKRMRINVRIIHVIALRRMLWLVLRLRLAKLLPLVVIHASNNVQSLFELRRNHALMTHVLVVQAKNTNNVTVNQKHNARLCNLEC
jgi:hypothetical protein